jgi:hypothetical protein
MLTLLVTGKFIDYSVSLSSNESISPAHLSVPNLVTSCICILLDGMYPTAKLPYSSHSSALS